MVFKGEALGRWVGHEGGALINGISVLIKEVPESSLNPFHHLRTQPGVCHPEKGPHSTLLAP